jgi:hypothetical protein
MPRPHAHVASRRTVAAYSRDVGVFPAFVEQRQGRLPELPDLLEVQPTDLLVWLAAQDNKAPSLPPRASQGGGTLNGTPHRSSCCCAVTGRGSMRRCG